jgi:hypothetical protein
VVSGHRRVGLGVGYVRVPAVGVIEALHALDPHSGRALCGRPVAIAWSAEDAAGTEIDCRECLVAMGETELAG